MTSNKSITTEGTARPFGKLRASSSAATKQTMSVQGCGNPSRGWLGCTDGRRRRECLRRDTFLATQEKCPKEGWPSGAGQARLRLTDPRWEKRIQTQTQSPPHPDLPACLTATGFPDESRWVRSEPTPLVTRRPTPLWRCHQRTARWPFPREPVWRCLMTDLVSQGSDRHRLCARVRHASEAFQLDTDSQAPRLVPPLSVYISVRYAARV